MFIILKNYNFWILDFWII